MHLKEKELQKFLRMNCLDLNEENGNEKNYIVFVQGSYPGDKVKARLLKIKKSYSEALALQILSPASERVKAKCKFFGTCGGCKQQDLDYDAQAKYKQQQVEEIFNKLGGFSGFEIEPIIPIAKCFSLQKQNGIFFWR